MLCWRQQILDALAAADAHFDLWFASEHQASMSGAALPPPGSPTLFAQRQAGASFQGHDPPDGSKRKWWQVFKRPDRAPGRGSGTDGASAGAGAGAGAGVGASGGRGGSRSGGSGGAPPHALARPFRWIKLFLDSLSAKFELYFFRLLTHLDSRAASVGALPIPARGKSILGDTNPFDLLTMVENFIRTQGRDSISRNKFRACVLLVVDATQLPNQACHRLFSYVCRPLTDAFLAAYPSVRPDDVHRADRTPSRGPPGVGGDSDDDGDGGGDDDGDESLAPHVNVAAVFAPMRATPASAADTPSVVGGEGGTEAGAAAAAAGGGAGAGAGAGAAGPPRLQRRQRALSPYKGGHRKPRELGSEELPRTGARAYPVVYCCPREPDSQMPHIVRTIQEQGSWRGHERSSPALTSRGGAGPGSVRVCQTTQGSVTYQLVPVEWHPSMTLCLTLDSKAKDRDTSHFLRKLAALLRNDSVFASLSPPAPVS